MISGLSAQCSTDILFGSNFEVDYVSEEHASVVYQMLAVDKEIKQPYFTSTS